MPRGRDVGFANFLPMLFFCAQLRRNMVSYAQTIQESLRSTHRLARLKPGKLNVCAKRSGGCAQPGVFLFRGSHRAFPGPQTNHGRRVRPLSLPVIGKRARRGDGWTRKSRGRSRGGTNAPILCGMPLCSGWLRTDQRGCLYR